MAACVVLLDVLPPPSADFRFLMLKGGGGEGSRTPVLSALNATFYMFSRVFNLEGASQPAGPLPSSIHGRSQVEQRLLSFDLILLSAPPDSAGVGRGTSRLTKPREPDLRNRWRLIFAQSF